MLMKNETAIVTGGTSGLGKRITEYFLAEGCRVAICSRKEQHVNQTVTEFATKYKDLIIGFPCDVADPIAIKSFIDLVAKELGSIRILVANAGLNAIYGPFANIPYNQLADYEHLTIGTILMGTIQTISATLPYMIQQKYGRIVTLCGGGVERPLPHQTIYSSAKGGVTTFSKCLALELAQRKEDIKINIYEPGFIRTGLINSGTIVPGWMDPEKSRENTDLALQYIGTDINISTLHVIPYALPSCKANGKLFRGYSIRKMIFGGIKLGKVMKQRRQSISLMEAT
jgi:3-oxoacyl-[acyl-carrier protein] reductase